MIGKGFVCAVMVAVMLAAPALAASERDRSDCQGSEPTRMISGCTRVIEDMGEAPRQRALALYMRGLAYIARGDADRAIADYDESIRLDPRNGLTFNERGLAFGTKGNLDRAVADFDRAIELHPGHGDIHYNRGKALLRADEIDRAIADFDQAIKLGPTSLIATATNDVITKLTVARIKSDYFHIRAHAKFLQGRYADAASDYAQVVALRRDDPYPALQLHLSRARSGQSGGIAELQAARSAIKQGEWPYPVVELLLNRKTAMEALALAKTPDQRCEAHYYIGEWNLVRADNGAAEMALQTAAATCAKDFSEYQLAQAELRRLRR
ncbi:MAG: tetratricopeptide repeat protein [Bradyrhizobium sp.]|uniref:tetratricopeptide repeat protein n=1 Tax=Bradyrhizobium sp. TaxID=376 RepID=UPI00347CC5C3